MLTVSDLVTTFSSADSPRKGTSASQVRAVDDVSFEVRKGELYTLLGPSGCGKSTTLRSIAGLETPDSGRIVVDGRPMFDSATKTQVPANRRGLGMVFQSYAIWPHLSVVDNVTFPLSSLSRRKRPSRAQIAERAQRVLTVTGLADYASRKATKLSGGQQQRLALARALIIEPPLLLLDEPLSNLDAKLRDLMRFEIKRLQSELGLTAVYVTHDQSEALSVSSRIAVMNAGRIEQVGKPREVYEQPSSKFVADFIGISNFLFGTVVPGGSGTVTWVKTDIGVVTCNPVEPIAVGSEVTLAVRPERLTLIEGVSEIGATNEYHGTITTRAFMGDAVEHMIDVGGTQVRNRSTGGQSLPVGTQIRVSIDIASVSVVPA